MKAEAEIGRWQRKKWEIEEKYNRLFTEFKRRGKTIIRLDNRNKKVEAELADMIQREASVCPEDVGCDEYIPILQRELSACKERMGQLEEKFNRYGQHLPNCALPEQKCNCGFHEACLEAQEQSKEKENDRIMAR